MINNCILVNLVLNCPSGIRKSKEASSLVYHRYNCDSSTGHYSKKIWGTALRDIKTLQGKIRKYHTDHTKPWMDSGFRIITQQNSLKYFDKMRGFRADLESLVDTLCNRVEGLKNEAKVLLGGLYREKDYVQENDIRKMINMHIKTMPVNSVNFGDDFRMMMSEQEAQFIKDQLLNDAENAAKEAMAESWNQLKGAIKRISIACSDDGRVSKTMVTSLQDVLESLRGFNLTNDKNIDKIIDEANSNLTSYSPSTLMDNDSARKAVKEKADNILRKIEGFSF